MFATRLSKVGERTLQISLQSNRTRQQSAAHNQNQDTALHRQTPQLHPHAQCGTSGEGSGAPRIHPEFQFNPCVLCGGPLQR
jgi:hypothetical protein